MGHALSAENCPQPREHNQGCEFVNPPMGASPRPGPSWRKMSMIMSTLHWISFTLLQTVNCNYCSTLYILMSIKKK